jgi:glycosyltransferase involved in cell wall biosynthesis
MTEESPLVSIVIPAYNHAGYLDEAIQSILCQDYTKIELIVLDDGSTDNTRTVLEKYTGKFHWETQTNMGQANTLNKGWQMSMGQILSYLSADDVLLPTAVSTSVECLEANPDVVLTYCDFNLIDPQSRIIRRSAAPEFSYRDMVIKLICHPGPGVFFRRSAFQAAGFWNSALRQMPDYDYWLRLGLFGKFHRIPGVLASFRLHTESQTFAKADPSKSEEPLRIIRSYFQRDNIPAEIRAAKNEALSNAHLVTAQLHLRSGRIRAGYDNFIQAFAIYPRNFLANKTLRLVLNALFKRTAYMALWKLKDFLAGKRA